MKKIYIFLVIVSIFFFIEPLIVLKTENVWMCSITGSKKSNIVWIAGITTNQQKEASCLEIWMKKKNKEIKNNWIKIVGNKKSLLGISSHEHSRAPAIYYFKDNLLQQFLNNSSDYEINNLIKVLSYASRKEQEELVDQLLEITLNKTLNHPK